jgi:hypothetical protein
MYRLVYFMKITVRSSMYPILWFNKHHNYEITAALPHNFSRGHALLGDGGWGRGLLYLSEKFFIRAIIYTAALPHNISRGQYLLFKIYYLILVCIKAIGFLDFAMILPPYKRAIFQIFQNIKV